MLPRTPFFMNFSKIWNRFHDDAYNGRKNARPILKELEVLMRKHYVSRGLSPKPVIDKIAEIDTILYMELCDEGNATSLDEKLAELSTIIRAQNTLGMNPARILKEYIKEFSSTWRMLNNSKNTTTESDALAEAVQAILDDIDDLAPEIAKFQLKNSLDGLYVKFNELVGLSGKVRQGITAVTGYSTIPKDVHKEVGEFMKVANQIVTFRPELLHMPTSDNGGNGEESEEEPTAMSLPMMMARMLTKEQMEDIRLATKTKDEGVEKSKPGKDSTGGKASEEPEKSGAKTTGEKKRGSEPEDSSAGSGEPGDPDLEEEEAEGEN